MAKNPCKALANINGLYSSASISIHSACYSAKLTEEDDDNDEEERISTQSIFAVFRLAT